jgi:hypothetical protein
LHLPKLPWQDLILEPASPATRATRLEVRHLTSDVSLGGPISIPITPADLTDDDALAFITARAGDFSFHLVHLACTFRSSLDEKFQKVLLEISLRRGDGRSQPEPIALSMKPTRLDEPVELARTIKLGTSLKLLNTGAEEYERRTVKRVFLEAFNELRSNPAWELNRTDTTEIRGSQRFILVVQAPCDAASYGTVNLSAAVERKKFGVFPYAAFLPDHPPIQFHLD